MNIWAQFQKAHAAQIEIPLRITSAPILYFHSDADASFPGRSAVSGARVPGDDIGGLLLEGNIDGVSTGLPPVIGFAGISGSGGDPAGVVAGVLTGEATDGGGDGGDETGETSLPTGLATGEEAGAAAGASGDAAGGVDKAGEIVGVVAGGEAAGDFDGDAEWLGRETAGE